jgi:hypothetical protein
MFCWCLKLSVQMIGWIIQRSNEHQFPRTIIQTQNSYNQIKRRAIWHECGPTCLFCLNHLTTIAAAVIGGVLVGSLVTSLLSRGEKAVAQTRYSLPDQIKQLKMIDICAVGPLRVTAACSTQDWSSLEVKSQWLPVREDQLNGERPSVQTEEIMDIIWARLLPTWLEDCLPWSSSLRILVSPIFTLDSTELRWPASISYLGHWRSCW